MNIFHSECAGQHTMLYYHNLITDKRRNIQTSVQWLEIYIISFLPLEESTFVHTPDIADDKVAKVNLKLLIGFY